MLSLAEFNGLPRDQARQALAACCASPQWAEAVAAGRPYPGLPELAARSDAAAAELAPGELRAALAGHPRIGAAPGGSGCGPGWSGQEQSGVDQADGQTMQALAAGNLAYERRFGHIYLACATGRSGADLLALLRDRLGNDPEAEWRVVRTELAKINRIRLGKLIG